MLTCCFLSYSDLFVPTHCSCKELSLHLITLSGTNTLGRSPLDEGSASRRYLYLTTQHTRDKHACHRGGIRTRDPSKLAAADPRLRPRGHLDRLADILQLNNSDWLLARSLLTPYTTLESRKYRCASNKTCALTPGLQFLRFV